MNITSLSFNDLEHADLESVGSFCLSDNSMSSQVSSSYTSFEPNNVEDIDQYAKTKVAKILRSIQKLEKLQISSKESNLSMLVFMEMIKDQQYKHVSLSLLNDFMKQFVMIPKSSYIHYYIYFLHYGYYYHKVRSTTEIINPTMKDKHKIHYKCLLAQTKYVQNIIKESKNRKSKISSEENELRVK